MQEQFGVRLGAQSVLFTVLGMKQMCVSFLHGASAVKLIVPKCQGPLFFHDSQSQLTPPVSVHQGEGLLHPPNLR